MHSFQVMYLFDASRERDQKRKRVRESGREMRRRRRRGKGRERRKKKYKETDRKPRRDGRGKSLTTTYYWCVAMWRKESSLTLLILSTASFRSTKSTLHRQTLSTLLLARQRLEWKEAAVYCTIKAACNHAPISSLTTLSFIDIGFN